MYSNFGHAPFLTGNAISVISLSCQVTFYMTDKSNLLWTRPFLSGNVISDSQENNEYHTTTGIVVAQLNQGDVVKVRSNPKVTIHGSVLSSNTHRTSFSGFQLY